MSDAPTVPARNDSPPGIDLYARSRANEIARRDEKFHYEWLSTDPEHPQYVGNRLRRHEIGDGMTGYTLCEPWEVVEDKDVQQMGRRPDGGKVDTSIRNGKMVLCRTPKANADRYRYIAGKRAERMPAGPDQNVNPALAKVYAGLHKGFAEDGAASVDLDRVRKGEI